MGVSISGRVNNDNKEGNIENGCSSQANQFRKEQCSCPKLEKPLKDAKNKKNNYWIDSDLLYHTRDVGGQKYVQFVVPESKEILKLPHETPTGGHLGSKKTRDRIAMPFIGKKCPKKSSDIVRCVMIASWEGKQK